MPRANHYRFDQGADGELVYIDPDLSGGRQLIYKEQSHSGTDMSAYKSDIGLLATVELETAPDAYTTSLTLLVPPVNVNLGRSHRACQHMGDHLQKSNDQNRSGWSSGASYFI